MTKKKNTDTVNMVKLELEDDNTKKVSTKKKKSDVNSEIKNAKVLKAKDILMNKPSNTDVNKIIAFSMGLVQAKIDTLVESIKNNPSKHNFNEKIENIQRLESYLDSVNNEEIEPLCIVSMNTLSKGNQGKELNAIGIKTFTQEESHYVFKVLSKKIKIHNDKLEALKYSF